MIFIKAVGNDKTIESELTEFFLKEGSLIIKKNSIKYSGNKFLVNFISEIPFILENANAILLSYSEINTKNINISSGNYIGVCENENITALSFFMEKKISTLTYGMSATDTVTFSSISNPISQISLQREIKNIKNKCVEPFEYSLPYGNFSKESQLIIGTIKILCTE